MILTASDVSELSRELIWWERGEYFFSFIVAAACFGEYVADFRSSWYRTGNSERDELRKEHISKTSTLVLVAALVLELLCVVRANDLSGRVIGSIDLLAADAASKAGTASDKADKAQTVAKGASDTAGAANKVAGEATGKANSAKLEADGVARQAEKIDTQLSQAEVTIKEHVEDVANPRMVLPITPTFHDGSSRADLFKELQKFAGTKVLIQV